MPGKPQRQRRYHILSNEALKTRWEEHGDREARSVLDHRRIIRDLATNPDTEIAEPLIRLGFRFSLQFKKNRSGRVGMWLELPESITTEQFKAHLAEIRQWQDFLDDWQGPPEFGGSRYVLSLYKKHRRGVSYADLAKSVEADALDMLEWIRSQERSGLKQAIRKVNHWSDQDMHY